MGETILLAAKMGVAALPIIAADWGVMVAFCAFFAVIPLGHFTVGIILALIAFFIPHTPDNDRHDVKLQAVGSQVQAGGNIRTVLFAISALVIAGSFVEGAVR